MPETIAKDLLRIQSWAKEKIAQGNEPPWAWYQYMKLIETVQALTAGMAATVTKESSPQSDSRPGAHLRLVDSTDQPDNAPHRPAGLPIQLPT
jgi:hypothetical protein